MKRIIQGAILTLALIVTAGGTVRAENTTATPAASQTMTPDNNDKQADANNGQSGSSKCGLPGKDGKDGADGSGAHGGKGGKGGRSGKGGTGGKAGNCPAGTSTDGTD
ncbi:hypothetical protein [Oryzifoliimicrobium ureilyticus]|uniref:hypothetical protein n=1 Tax=Oryzifoliimicrobium ureilyticus TaxID=3113724 RepID=UPI0030765AE7